MAIVTILGVPREPWTLSRGSRIKFVKHLDIFLWFLSLETLIFMLKQIGFCINLEGFLCCLSPFTYVNYNSISMMGSLTQFFCTFRIPGCYNLNVIKTDKSWPLLGSRIKPKSALKFWDLAQFILSSFLRVIIILSYNPYQLNSEVPCLCTVIGVMTKGLIM